MVFFFEKLDTSHLSQINGFWHIRFDVSAIKKNDVFRAGPPIYKVIYLTMGPQDIVYEFFERGHLDPVKHLQDHRTNNQLAK